jgi:hypothetical protein
MFCENYEWVEVDKAQPRIRAEVLFVVRSKDPVYHGRILAGRYHGNRYGYHGFSIPGIEFEGSHWGVLPEPPAKDKEGQAITQQVVARLTGKGCIWQGKDGGKTFKPGDRPDAQPPKTRR